MSKEMPFFEGLTQPTVLNVIENIKTRKTAEINKLIEEMTVTELMHTLSVSERTIQEWTQGRRQELKKQRDRRIIELYLDARNTQEKVAEIVSQEMPFFEGLGQQTVADVISSTEKRRSAEIGKLFDYSEKDRPYLYNILNLKKQDRKDKLVEEFNFAQKVLGKQVCPTRWTSKTWKGEQ